MEGVIRSEKDEKERVAQRIARHARVFLGKAVYKEPQNAALSAVEIAALGLRKILLDGQHEKDGISYFNSSEYGPDVLAYPGLVACAIAYIKSDEATKNNAGRLFLEGVAYMAPANVEETPELNAFLRTPDEKLTPALRARIEKLKKILDDKGYSLSFPDLSVSLLSEVEERAVRENIVLFMGRAVDEKGSPLPPSVFTAALGLQEALCDLHSRGGLRQAQRAAQEILGTPGLLGALLNYGVVGKGLSREASKLLVGVFETFVPGHLAQTPEGQSLLAQAGPPRVSPPGRASGAVGRCDTVARTAPQA